MGFLSLFWALLIPNFVIVPALCNLKQTADNEFLLETLSVKHLFVNNQAMSTNVETSSTRVVAVSGMIESGLELTILATVVPEAFPVGFMKCRFEAAPAFVSDTTAVFVSANKASCPIPAVPSLNFTVSFSIDNEATWTEPWALVQNCNIIGSASAVSQKFTFSTVGAGLDALTECLFNSEQTLSITSSPIVKLSATTGECALPDLMNTQETIFNMTILNTNVTEVALDFDDELICKDVQTAALPNGVYYLTGLKSDSFTRVQCTDGWTHIGAHVSYDSYEALPYVYDLSHGPQTVTSTYIKSYPSERGYSDSQRVYWKLPARATRVVGSLKPNCLNSSGYVRVGCDESSYASYSSTSYSCRNSENAFKAETYCWYGGTATTTYSFDKDITNWTNPTVKVTHGECCNSSPSSSRIMQVNEVKFF